MLEEAEYTELNDILQGKAKTKVKIHGWLHNRRTSGGIQFLLVRDGISLIQCTLKKDSFDKQIYEAVNKLPVESLIELEGNVREDSRAPGGYEIVVEKIKILQMAEEDYPIAKKYHGPDFILDQRHFYIRDPKIQRIIKVRAKLLEAAREWFKDHGFIEIHVPTLVGAACEGGSTLFELNYFDQKAYLTQSWQLYGEAAIAAVGKCFTVAPSFRAEKSRTRRHLTEYLHLEGEEPWCDLECTMCTQEKLITYVLHSVATEMPDELKKFGRDADYLSSIKPPLKRVTYDEVIEILQNLGLQFNWGDDIDWKIEKVLTEQFDKPFFITHFPIGVKAFYHKPDSERPEVTLSVDMLAPEGYGEIIGGGQRIHDYKELMKRIKEENLDASDYQWYVDLRKYGCPPHSGFGLGIERLLSWLCKLDHIRDAVLFPRLINRVYP